MARRLIPFIYSAKIAYMLEFGHKYIRVYYGNDVLKTELEEVVWIETPYEESHLFELQTKQLGDTIWIVHPSYPPSKLKRLTAYSFTLEEIEFTSGPFLKRNDLANLDITNPTTLACSATEKGTYGVLTATSDVFTKEHEKALFKLWHPRSTKTVTLSGAGTTSSLHGKGTYNLITRGTWTGTIYWQERIEGKEWVNRYIAKSSKNAYQNVSVSYKEKNNYMEHRLYSPDASSALRAELSIDEPLESGVVRIISYGSPRSCVVQVVSKVYSTSPTEKWAEGAWSKYRGYPAAFTFFEDRACYGGASFASDPSYDAEIEYPTLKEMT